MKKSIFYVLPDLSVIGAQRLAIDYGKRLQVDGYDVKWCTGSLHGGFLDELSDDEVVSFSDFVFSKIRLIRLFEKIFRLLFVIRRKKPDVVISITPFYNRVLCLFSMCRLIDTKLVIEDHAYPPNSYIDEFGCVSRFFYKHTEFLYKYADRFRVLSQESKLYYDKSLGGNYSIVQTNYLNVDRILSLAAHCEPSIPLKVIPRLVYIGRFTTQKNIDFLIRSFAILLKRFQCELFIIGYGPEELNLKRVAFDVGCQESVFFVSSSNANYSNLKTADLFPMVSIWEGMGLVLVEAMALRVPVISTDFNVGPRFILGLHNERGVIVKKNSEQLFADAMFDVLNDTDGCVEDRVSQGESFVLNEIDIKRNFKNYINEFVSF